jgi:hypothetical protein
MYMVFGGAIFQMSSEDPMDISPIRQGKILLWRRCPKGGGGKQLLQ